ncbi:hypothetical protein OHA77_27980 [Streptosporangium sp. NBC_01639]|uniref:hypothetical protein n=1 Tax=Streptosporangium sp. NBC_01639 TaxID=2975948 RepID=UPI00386ADFDB|nr:hypothetical protein OHA77_27980 [Streptosporangium sp. NBC_01639]
MKIHDWYCQGLSASAARMRRTVSTFTPWLMRLRYGGSAHRWDFAIYSAGKDSYEDRIWSTGSPQEALDLVCDIYATNTWPLSQPGT